MEPSAPPPPKGESGFSFPPLPIVTVDPPRLTTSEKYGGLFYFGLVGLLVLLALVGWFVLGAWSMRNVWSNVYVLHDTSRPEAERVQAAFELSRDSRVNQRQRWDICLRRTLPDLARYLLAESLTREAASADPRGYALAVARSPGWPDWLRLLLLRPMGYAVIEGEHFPREPIELLAKNNDVAIRMWAAFVLSQDPEGGRSGLGTLEESCRNAGPERELACLLLEAARLDHHPSAQAPLLDRATTWLRSHAPGDRVWSGWTIDGGRIVGASASKLQ